MALRLRYRIESPTRFRAHVHFVDGAGYFFYPGYGAGKGAPVLLEVACVSGESLLFRGYVWARPHGQGMWLELPSSRRALDWAESFRRRADRRIGTEQLVLVQSEGRPALLCRVRDVSHGGARLAAVPADVGHPGETVHISLPEAGPGGVPLDGVGQVAWGAEGEIGLAWIRSDLCTRVTAARLLHAVEEEWERAPEVAHAAGCPCGPGAKPPPPVVLLG